MTGTANGRLSPRGQALLEHLSAAGVTVAAEALSKASVGNVHAADLVLLTAMAEDETLDALIVRSGFRRKAGRFSMFFRLTSYPTSPLLVLLSSSPAAAALAARCGLVTAPNGAVRDAELAISGYEHTSFRRCRAAPVEKR